MRLNPFHGFIVVNPRKLISFTLVVWACAAILCFFSHHLGFPERIFQAKETYSFSRYIVEFSGYFLGNLMIFLIPGSLWIAAWTKKDLGGIGFLSVSFIVSVTLLIIFTSLCKIIVPSGIEFPHFLFVLILLTGTGLIACLAKKDAPVQTIKASGAWTGLFVALILCVGLIGWAFQENVLWVNFDGDFSPEHVLTIPLGMQDDVMENFGLADSLKKNLLPYWDLEYADRFGFSIIDPPLSSFLSFFLLMFFGGAYAVHSLNTLLVVAVSFFLAAQFALSGIERPKWPSLIFVIPFVLICYLWIFLHHPESSLVLIDHIHWMTLFVLAQYYFLVHKRQKLFLAFALLAFLTKFEAAFFTIAGLAAYQMTFKPQRKEIWGLGKKYLFLIFPYILIMAAIGWSRGDLGAYIESFFVERFTRLDHWNLMTHFFSDEATSPWGRFSWESAWTFSKQWLIASGILGVAIFYPRKDKTSWFLSGVAVLYFLLVFISREKRVHYISPLVFFSIIIALRIFFQAQWTKKRV